MSLTYRIDSSAGLIHITSRGRVSASDMEQVAASLLQDPEFKPGLDVLSDSRELTVAPSTDDARVAANLIEGVARAGLRRVAIVATNPSIFGMYQLIAQIAESRGQQVMVFDRIDEALAWLGEPPVKRAAPRPRRSGPGGPAL